MAQTYSHGLPIRLVGGRLALDFINTADWSENGLIVHEKLTSDADLRCWMEASGIGSAVVQCDLAGLLELRAGLRNVFMSDGDPGVLDLAKHIRVGAQTSVDRTTFGQRLDSLLAVSALAILTDRRERYRLKICPGDDCGWIFIDETKNGRRIWCSMETCGNRSKAARHYARTKEGRRK